MVHRIIGSVREPDPKVGFLEQCLREPCRTDLIPATTCLHLHHWEWDAVAYAAAASVPGTRTCSFFYWQKEKEPPAFFSHVTSSGVWLRMPVPGHWQYPQIWDRSRINTINNLCEQVENTVKSIFRSFHSLKKSMPRGYCNWALLKLEMSDNPYIEKEKTSPQSLFEVSKALKIKWDRLWINLIYEKY